MKRCEEVEQYLGDYAGRRLQPDESRQIDSHLADCEACRASLEEVVALRSAIQSLPSEIHPEHDLWPEISARLHSGSGEKRRGKLWVAWRVLAVAASLLIVVGSVVFFDQWAPSRSSWTGAAGDGSDRVGADVAKAEQAFEQATKDLLVELQAAKGGGLRDTQRMLDGDLNIANQAISEIKSALLQQPNDPELARKLLVAHERRLEMLQYVAQISMSNRYGG